MKPILLLLLSAGVACTAEGVKGNTPYAASEVTLAASVTADVVSSFGPGIETNPLLGRGTFGARQVAIAIAPTIALLVIEKPLLHKFPRLRHFFTVINFSTAAPHAYAAFHNIEER